MHTVGFLVDEFRNRMRSELPGTDSFHVLNEGLLQDLLRGADPRAVHARVAGQLRLAEAGGATLIVMTCSSTSPGVDIARADVQVPILKIDDPMADQAVATGRRIGLLCTATSTVEPSTALLLSHARRQGRDIEVVPVVCAEAYRALMAGDRPAHDALVAEAAAGLQGKVDVLVLAQASLAPLRETILGRLGCPVLASPSLLMQELVRRVRSATAGPVENTR